MKRILITGGTGFIGINLIKSLLLSSKDKKNQIYVLTRKKFIIVDQNDYEIFSKIKFIKGDIVNFTTNIIFHEIYHLAYDTHTKKNFLKYTSKTIIDGLINISRVCNLSKTKKFVFISSGSVYENLNKKNFKTNDMLSFNLFNENEHYGILKAASEQYLWSIFKNTDTQLSIYRVFAVLGPYMRLDGSFIIGNLINNLINNKPNNFNTDCKVYRNIIYIDDLIKQITKKHQSNFSVQNVIGKNINLRNFLVDLSKKEKFKIKFGIKKNKYKIFYMPRLKKDNFNKNYAYTSFKETFDWFKKRKYRKIYIK